LFQVLVRVVFFSRQTNKTNVDLGRFSLKKRRFLSILPEIFLLTRSPIKLKKAKKEKK
jgi:hypothetical protein